ncbi:hypothetical protein ACQPWO_29050, partial [Escherichia coli]
MVRRKKKCGDCGNSITHNTVCCLYCGAVVPSGYYRKTDRLLCLLTLLLVLILVTGSGVSVFVLLQSVTG